MPEYNVTITEAVWRGKPSTVLLRTPEGVTAVYERGSKESHKLELSAERAQELRSRGYLAEPVKPPKPPKDEPEPVTPPKDKE